MSISPFLDLKEKMLKEREERLAEREKAITQKLKQEEQSKSKSTETLTDCIKNHYANAK